VSTTTAKTLPPVIPDGGLRALAEVVLDDERQRLLDTAVASCGGPPFWRERKMAEARELAALSQRAPRFVIHELDLRESLRLLASLRVPVPCRPDGEGRLRVAPGALLGITYPAEAILMPQPGTQFVQILEPRDVWHANASAGPIQHLCLGVRLPEGIPVKEIVLSTYSALAMVTIQVDQFDPAGILNREAATWWQANADKCPLSEAPFLSPFDD